MLAAERICDSIAGQGLAIGDGAVAITVSIGACTSNDDHEMTPDTMLACADRALRQAKVEGKNRVRAQPPHRAAAM